VLIPLKNLPRFCMKSYKVCGVRVGSGGDGGGDGGDDCGSDGGDANTRLTCRCS
jgi:hypothetical protein